MTNQPEFVNLPRREIQPILAAFRLTPNLSSEMRATLDDSLLPSVGIKKIQGFKLEVGVSSPFEIVPVISVVDSTTGQPVLPETQLIADRHIPSNLETFTDRNNYLIRCLHGVILDRSLAEELIELVKDLRVEAQQQVAKSDSIKMFTEKRG